MDSTFHVPEMLNLTTEPAGILVYSVLFFCHVPVANFSMQFAYLLFGIVYSAERMYLTIFCMIYSQNSDVWFNKLSQPDHKSWMKYVLVYVFFFSCVLNIVAVHVS